MNPDLWYSTATSGLLMSPRAAAIGMAIAVLVPCLLAWRRRRTGFPGIASILLVLSQTLRWALLRGDLTPWIDDAGKASLSAACLGLGASALLWMVARGLRVRRAMPLGGGLAWILASLLTAVSAGIGAAAFGIAEPMQALSRLSRLDAAHILLAFPVICAVVAAIAAILLLAMAFMQIRRRSDGIPPAKKRTVPLPQAHPAASLPADGHRQIETRLATLNEVLERQRQMNALLAHEIRAPVSTISAAVQSLEMVLEGSDEQIDSRLQRIGRAVTRITELMDQLLGQESAYDEAVAPHQEVVDLARLASDIVVAVQGDVAHRLHIEAPTPAFAWCDGPLTGVVLRNLIQNAVKYSPADQPILIQVGTLTARGERTAWIAVQDRGPGIEKEDQARIFEPHFRRAAHRETKGLGLGLYLVRKICERQGGTLAVESEPGKGARFTIFLPIPKGTPRT
jgi:signal transduction histidine kinase